MVKKILVSDSIINYNFTSLNPSNLNTLTDSICNYLAENQDEYCMLTSNNIITSTQPGTLNGYFSTIISNNKNGDIPGKYEFDICYISKWLDNCFSYSSQFNLDDNGTTLVRTSGPRGYETLLFAPSGIKIFISRHPAPRELSLNEYLLQDINVNALISVTFTQSPVFYDPLNATTVSDYVRTVNCQNVPPISQEPEVSNLYFFYFILIIVVIFVAAWIIFKLGPALNSSIDDYPFLSNPLAVKL